MEMVYMGVDCFFHGRRTRTLSRARRSAACASLLVLPLAVLLVWLLPGTTEALSSGCPASSSATAKIPPSIPHRSPLVTTIAEDVWRTAAKDHRHQIKTLLEPGLVDLDHPRMRSLRKQLEDSEAMTMLDPKHPIYNFLVEYYGLKGLKGPKMLARWAPSVGLFFWKSDMHNNNSNEYSNGTCSTRRIESLQDYHTASCLDSETIQQLTTNNLRDDETDRRIFLEGATPDDFGFTLYLQGAEWIESSNHDPVYGGKEGILYRPIRYYDISSDESKDLAAQEKESTTLQNSEKNSIDDSNTANLVAAHKKATSFAWYKSILQNTLQNEAVLHCYGLHEWAMQYHPEGAEPPPSGKYQAHLPLRVSRETINTTVERKGLRCTHVDALRFFAPSAGPLNYHGATLERKQQLELEQPGCVHAHMDLLKIALRIKPYCDVELLVDVLEIALQARTLDVGASPYDCSSYQFGTERKPIPIIPVETAEGRALYKKLQSGLMVSAESVRKRLLANYEAFGYLAFSSDQLDRAQENPTNERFAKAEPGGRAWRQNLIDTTGRTVS